MSRVFLAVERSLNRKVVLTVLDFGIAKAVSNSTAASPGTTTVPRLALQGTGLGAPTCIAPESRLRAIPGSIVYRADIYSVGCVAYEMLTGHPPIRGKTPQAVMIAHAKETPEPVGKRWPDAPLALAKFVMPCLEMAPDRRPRRVQEIAHALRGAQASRSGAKGLLERPPWRLPWLLALVSSAAALGLALAR